jgi:hypothetical protein
VEHQCPKCMTPSTKAAVNAVQGKLIAIKEPIKYFRRNIASTLSVYVCSSCGFVEWYADEPEKFR